MVNECRGFCSQEQNRIWISNYWHFLVTSYKGINQSFLSTYLGRETIGTFSYEKQSLGLYKGSLHMSLRKNFLGMSLSLSVSGLSVSAQKATETATATLAAL